MSKVNTQEYRTAWAGSLTINDTDAHTGQWKGLYITDDAVFAQLKDQNDVDITSEFMSTPANGIKAGALKTIAGGNSYIKTIQLTSGQVEAINDVFE